MTKNEKKLLFTQTYRYRCICEQKDFTNIYVRGMHDAMNDFIADLGLGMEHVRFVDEIRSNKHEN